jgi:putative membrane protein
MRRRRCRYDVAGAARRRVRISSPDKPVADSASPAGTCRLPPAVAAVGLLMVTAVALAQVDMKDPSTNSSNGGDKTQPSATDRKFMKTLAEGGMAEVEAGKLATEKASDPGVKQFGEQMVKDHTQNNEQLRTLAKNSGVSLPTKTDQQLATQESRLESDTGASFDTAYIRDQVQDHQKTVQLLEHEIQDGHDPAVRQFARETLQVVNHHLAMAKELQSKLPSHVAEGSPQ